MTLLNGTATKTYYEVADNNYTGVAISIESNDGSISKHFVNFDPHDYEWVDGNQTEILDVNVESFIATYEHSRAYETVEKQVFKAYLECDGEECECFDDEE